jgi:hypothetical protein
MNKNNTTTPAIVAIFMIATLVIGATFAARTATTQLAFAAVSKKGVGGQQQENSKNGNTVTIEECKNRGSASGFDTSVNQECENLICTHPGENATCTQEGAAAPQTPTPQPTPTTTLRVIKNVVCLATDPNCAVPSDFTIGVFQPEQPIQTVVGQSGAGTVVTLVPGMFRVMENTTQQFNAILSGQCSGDIAAGQQLTCTVTNTEQAP